MKTRHDENDEVLRDGQTRRFSMAFMDAASRDLAERARRAFNDAPLIVDAAGGTEGLHRNGYRYPAPGTPLAVACDQSDKARVAYVQRLNDGWKPAA